MGKGNTDCFLDIRRHQEDDMRDIDESSQPCRKHVIGALTVTLICLTAHHLRLGRIMAGRNCESSDWLESWKIVQYGDRHSKARASYFYHPPYPWS